MMSNYCQYRAEAIELVKRYGCIVGSEGVAQRAGLTRGALQYSLYCAWRLGVVVSYGISRRTRAWCDGPLRQLAGSLNGRIAVLRVSDAAVAAMSLIERGVRYVTAGRIADAMGLPRTVTWAHDLANAVLHFALDGVPSERLRTRHGGRGWLVLDLRAAVEGLSRIAEAGELPLEPDPPPPPPAPRRRSDGVYVSAHVPHNYVDLMNMLVKAGVYPSRSEIVRDAIRKLLEQYRGA